MQGPPPKILTELRRRLWARTDLPDARAAGCLVQTTADEQVVAPGRPVQVVDTVGAGDAFTAGLLCAVLEGKDLGEAAAFANRLAGQVAAAPGGTPKVDRKEIE